MAGGAKQPVAAELGDVPGCLHASCFVPAFLWLLQMGLNVWVVRFSGAAWLATGNGCAGWSQQHWVITVPGCCVLWMWMVLSVNWLQCVSVLPAWWCCCVVVCIQLLCSMNRYVHHASQVGVCAGGSSINPPHSRRRPHTVSVLLPVCFGRTTHAQASSCGGKCLPYITVQLGCCAGRLWRIFVASTSITDG